MSFKTPGVYIKEVSLFPPSVAEVETAIPAFIGYTEKAQRKGQDLFPDIANKIYPTAVKIGSLLEFQAFFGGPPAPRTLSVELDAANNPLKVSIVNYFCLYDSLRMFFDNGGGDCYIVAVGSYKEKIDHEQLKEGINALKKEDEPTLLLFPDAVNLNKEKLAAVQNHALQQCNDLQDRFCIFDVKNDGPNADIDEEIQGFRDNIGINYTKYGAAYYPFIRTTIALNPKFQDISLTKNGNPISLDAISTDTKVLDKVKSAIRSIEGDPASAASLDGLKKLQGPFHGSSNNQTYREWFEANTTADKTQIEDWARVIKKMAEDLLSLSSGGSNVVPNADVLKLIDNTIALQGNLATQLQKLVNYDLGYVAKDIAPTPAPLGIIVAANNFNGTHPFSGAPNYNLVTNKADSSIYGTGSTPQEFAKAAAGAFGALFETVLGIINNLVAEAEVILLNLESDLLNTNPVYSNIVRAIGKENIVIPPSGIIAGIYAAVDEDRGVWKAPANVSLASVVGPVVKIDDKDQESLNVDPNSGKSINAIRFFSGKGTLVWGARTLAGNDAEWRYISVRRFFNMVEESVKKASAFAVFEPNDARTWSKVRAMISNYLVQKWKDGALQGNTSEEAFFVKIGLGLTMTADDILNGFMRVEIGMAVVRPAEFIVLQFSHKLVGTS